MEKRKVGFIGGGRITKILLEGFEKTGILFDGISVYDPNEESLLMLQEKFPEIRIEKDEIKNVANADIIFVAVHPPVFIEALTKIKPFVSSNTMLISLAPKILISKMKEILPENKSIVRVNPSAPNVIGQGMNPITFSADVNQDDKKYALELFGKIGRTFEVEEEKIEAYAVISAMGSTYFWFQLQHLMELGVQFGLDTDESKMTISEMMKSTLNTLFFSDMIAEEVMDLVPVRPMGEYEEEIKNYYSEKLTGIFNKIRP